MPSLSHIESPHSLKDIDLAVQRLIKAKNDDELINLCTDFDADGQNSLAVLYRGLKILGFKDECLTYMSAHRLIEGYGLNDMMVERILDQKPRCSLIVTADNGSSNADSIAKLADNGIDVIVTDHHALLDGPPARALAVVNPVRSDCDFPDKAIAGVSVAFMVLIHLRQKLIEAGELDSRISIAPLLTFCGLGVQADCVHLGNSLSNRAMVRYALHLIEKRPPFVCWQALKNLNKNADAAVNSEFLSFTVAPAINAAGRLDTAKPAGELFLTDDIASAIGYVNQLAEFNERRKLIERSMAQAAKAIAKGQYAKKQYGLFCFLPEGNPGVVGIVSSRLLSTFGQPSLTLAPMMGKSDIVSGSMRSPEAYDVKDGIEWINQQYPGLILRGGGHSRAGGLSVAIGDLERLEEAFEQSCRAQISDWTVLGPTLRTDGVLAADEITLELFDEIQTLQPFGQGFPSPAFEAECELISTRMVGKPAVHAQLELKIGGRLIKGIWFFCKEDPADNLPVENNQTYRWIFNLSENRFRGSVTLQLIVVAVL